MFASANVLYELVVWPLDYLPVAHWQVMLSDVPYSGKVWRGECLANLLFLSVWQEKVWQMNRSAKGL